MVVVISYIVAIILTVLLALTLYPVAAMFWVLGLLGKLSDTLFSFTRKTIKGLWSDINNTEIRSRKITSEVVNDNKVELLNETVTTNDCKLEKDNDNG